MLKPSEKYRLLIIFSALFLVVLLFMPRSPKFKYEYRKGSPWKYETLIAQFDFPIYKSDEQILEEKSKQTDVVIPYYRYSEETVNRNLKAAESLQIEGGYSLRSQIVSSLRKLYSQGILSDESLAGNRKNSGLSTELVYIQKDKRAKKYPVSELYVQSVAKAKLISDVSAAYPKLNVDSIFKANNVYELVVPNLVFDSKTTDLLVSETYYEVSPTQGFVPAGTLIVSNGELVTAEIAQMLGSYKIEFENNVGTGYPTVWLWIGNIIVAMALVLVLFLAIFFANKQILYTRNQLFYLLFVFLFALVLEFVSNKFFPDLIYLVPFPLIALYLQAFFKKRLVVTVYMISLLPMLVVTNFNPVLFFLFLLSGMVYVYIFSYFNRSWMQFVSALVSFILTAIAYTGLILSDTLVDEVGWSYLYLFIGSILCVAAYPLVFVFEMVFGLVSNTRLEELTDTNNALLRRLDNEAPGTFQHSLQVMSMADAAARSIDANVLLVRAGALYHDIGKLGNPLCFTENEGLLLEEGARRFHDGLTPKESASHIINHVHDGLELAAKYKVPWPLREFILTHHGTSRTNYFYNKYINDGGDPEDTGFTYDGKKPETKEQVILMLCDSLEAAARTMVDNSAKTRSELVEEIFAQKLSEGQFDDADISLKEINVVKDTLKSYLSQLYHERIAYPKRKIMQKR